MLEFYFDFMLEYVDPQDFQYVEMDTDSAYMALSAPVLADVIKPNLRTQYQQQKHLWFPREDTPEHTAYDQRTPGLFKAEWIGRGFVGLCSKCYYCFGSTSGGDKLSCKGVNKKQNPVNKDSFLQVLRTKQPGQGANRGFRTWGTSVVTYVQHKSALSYLYPKRKVQEDGITTLPLDL